jgi:antitoxin component YwqK of YwqJK toxin-antitoxin module
VTGANYQYEPYYQNSQYNVVRSSGELTNETGVARLNDKDSMASKAGFENTVFNRTGIVDY